MMSKAHTKKYFLDWLEGKLNPQEMDKVEQHLRSCADCRTYFDKMKMMLIEPEASVLPDLEPDYFLPTRIAELAKAAESKPSVFGLWKKRVRMAVGAALIVAALSIGIFLGKWMSHQQDYSETEIVLSYASMFSDEGLGEVWDNVIPENNGEQQ